MTNTPRVDRPQFPDGYGIPTSLEGLLPWEHASQRLQAALIYWVGTVRPNGRPHTSPIWGVWLENKLYFDGSAMARRSQNIAQNPAVAIHIESGGDGKEVVMLEGDAFRVLGVDFDLDYRKRLSAAYIAKYGDEGYKPEPDQWDEHGIYEIRPRTVIAWTTFNVDPTRWRFQHS